MDKSIIIVYGIPGSGKTTVSNLLSDVIPESIVLSNDVLRRNLAHPIAVSIYTPKVYECLASNACKFLEEGKTVILDATFYLRRYRKIVIEQLWKLEHSVIFIKIETPVRICRKRIKEREKNHEKDFLTYLPGFERVAKEFEDWKDDELPNNYSRAIIKCNRIPKLIYYSENISNELIYILEKLKY
ncbi:hypothetical protein FACS1894137_08490 [Spirochaetia bacterium]|nr:hypothetical protein FACS1894137_08490 [Spirochaetia bacterium]